MDSVLEQVESVVMEQYKRGKRQPDHPEEEKQA
jgi:hypothetical protein